MRDFLFPLALPLAAALLAPLAAPAETAAPKVDVARLGLGPVELAEISGNPSAMLQRYYLRVLTLSPDGSVTGDQLELQKRLDAARLKAGRLAQYFTYDLNGDGKLDGDEIAKLSTALPLDERARLLVLRDTADRNGDGTLDTPELLAAAGRPQPGYSGASNQRMDDALRKMDIDGDGRTTLAEIHAVLAAIAPQLDPAAE